MCLLREKKIFFLFQLLLFVFSVCGRVRAAGSAVMKGPTRHHRNQKSAALALKMWYTLCGSGSACAVDGGFGGAQN